MWSALSGHRFPAPVSKYAKQTSCVSLPKALHCIRTTFGPFSPLTANFLYPFPIQSSSSFARLFVRPFNLVRTLHGRSPVQLVARVRKCVIRVRFLRSQSRHLLTCRSRHLPDRSPFAHTFEAQHSLTFSALRRSSSLSSQARLEKHRLHANTSSFWTWIKMVGFAYSCCDPLSLSPACVMLPHLPLSASPASAATLNQIPDSDLLLSATLNTNADTCLNWISFN